MKTREEIRSRDREWYKKNRERVLTHKKKYWYENRQRKREIQAADYQRHKEQRRVYKKLYLNMKLITSTSDLGKRTRLYLKHKAYFDERVLNDMAWKHRKGPMAIAYISTDKSLKQIGVEYSIGGERVRQIVAEFLRKINRIYIKNAKELDARNDEPFKPIVSLKKTYRELEEENQQLRGQLVAVFNIVSKAKIGNEYEYDGNMQLVPAKKKIEIYAPKWRSVKKSSLQEIDDNGIKGYFLTDIKTYLGRSYNDFLDWYNGARSGVLNGKVYVPKTDFETFTQTITI